MARSRKVKVEKTVQFTDIKLVLVNGVSLQFTNSVDVTREWSKPLTEEAITWKGEDILNSISFEIGNKNVVWNGDVATLRAVLAKEGSKQVLLKVGKTVFKLNIGTINYLRDRNGLKTINESDIEELNNILVEFFGTKKELRRVTLFATREVTFKM